ncbi:MAG TPA: MBL fold metallo-hydrolase [Solirubrobacteraceae bacterium]|nr:MBL fold metallo-hydrolase [Solirubrobacteraceae bacterium]
MDEQASEAARLAAQGIVRVRADNAGPLTLSGTNTWLLGRDPTWIVDPGPALDGHVRRLLDQIARRGGLGGVALTHDHADHSGALPALLASHPAPLAAARGQADVRLADGVRFGPFQAFSTPGHARDHVALIAGDACFTGDAVLGEGSVFVAPYRGALAAYLDALARLAARGGLSVLCPGHGPPVWDAAGKLAEIIDHRMDRERALLAALRDGLRDEEELLDAAWADVPPELRPLAAVTLAAHLDKLAGEERLPAGVPRPRLERFAGQVDR